MARLLADALDACRQLVNAVDTHDDDERLNAVESARRAIARADEQNQPDTVICCQLVQPLPAICPVCREELTAP